MSEKKKSGAISGAFDYVRNKTGVIGAGLEGGFWGAFGWKVLGIWGVVNPMALILGAGVTAGAIMKGGGDKKSGK